MDADTIPQENDNCSNNEENLFLKFKCCKCYVLVDDLKLLKSHLWDYHLKRIENIKQNSVERSKKRAKSDKSDKTSKKKRKLEYSPNGDEISDPDETDDDASEFTEIEKRINIIEKLSEDDYTFFNFENIDERKILERALEYYPTNNFDKTVEVKKSKIGWAHWRARGVSIMWPCIIEKYAKDSSNSMKVFIRYYEVNNQKGNIFKLPLSKIDFFFKSNDHFDTKKTSTILTKFKYDFLWCYTNALKDFMKFLDEQNLNETVENESESVNLNKNESIKSKHLVNGKMFSYDEVKKMSEQAISEEQLKINKDRIENSEKLIQILLTPELEEHLVSIFSEKSDCTRHLNYINGDLSVRRKMKFSWPGPLVEDDQKKLAEFIINISKAKYEKKPEHLTTYEYDVLYPEAVIWGLRKLFNINYSKADFKYRQGFKRTDEERTKQRCFQILNSVEDNMDKMSSLNDSDYVSTLSKKDTSDSSIDKLEETCLDQEENCFEKAE